MIISGMQRHDDSYSFTCKVYLERDVLTNVERQVCDWIHHVHEVMPVAGKYFACAMNAKVNRWNCLFNKWITFYIRQKIFGVDREGLMRT